MLKIATSCRTCMKDNVTLVDLSEIVKTEENQNFHVQLAEMLVLCTAIEVSKEDGLPQKLCDECTKVLQLAYTFRNQAQKTQEEFKKLLQKEIKLEPQEADLKIENDNEYSNNFDDFSVEVFSDEIIKTEDVLPTSYSCSQCNKIYSTEKKFSKHLQSHGTVFKCTICDKSYHSQNNLNKHIAKHLNKHRCTVCYQEFKSELLLVKHMTKHAGNLDIKVENEAQSEVLQCPDCDQTFTKLRSLSMHVRWHKNKLKKEFICDSCGKTFNSKHQLKRHVILHSEFKPHTCTKCPKSYARKDQLTLHMRTHGDNKPYECSYCKKGFTQLCSLKEHIRSHTGETPFLCSQCGKGFTNRSNLRQHMMRHTGLKPHACSMCPMTFCTKGQMTSHMSTHTGEHPYKCEQCGAAFTKPTSLKKHKLIHLGIRPFACDTCNMRFTCKDHLKRHYRIHTGEKPYKCNYCERAFTQSNDLLKHTRAHIGQNTYQCSICSMRFRLMVELKQHYPTHFVEGKMQPPEVKEDIIPITPLSPTKELEPLLIFKPQLSHIPCNKDMPHLNLKPDEEDLTTLTSKSSVNGTIGTITNAFGTITEVQTDDDKNRYHIIINSCDKNGLVNGITINIPTKDS